MPADLERIFEAARQRRNWQTPPESAGPAGTPESARRPAAQNPLPAASPPPLTVLYKQLDEEVHRWLGPRADSAQFHLTQVRDLLTAVADSAMSESAPGQSAAPPFD